MRVTTTLIVATTAAFCAGPAVARADAGAVLDRVRGYLAQYERELVTLVADEHYVQTTPLTNPAARSTRVLDAEFGWVTIPALGETVGVREVLAVGGQPVGAERRLRRLLEQPPANPSREIATILAESATHNIGDVQRNINFPTFTLAYLRTRDGDGTRWRVDTTRDGLELQFEERGRSTLIRSPGGTRVPAQGSFLVDAATGRVLRSSLAVPLVTNGVKREYRLDVEFAEDARLRLWVPRRMRERSVSSGGSVEFAGEATYSNYRRYETGGRLVP